MVRGRPPTSIDQLRLVLDKASARRALIGSQSPDLPGASARKRPAMPPASRARTVIVAVDRDYLAAIVAESDRLDTRALAEAVGAHSARLLGPQAVRKWLGLVDEAREDETPGPPLAWDEVPLVTLLPTVIDQGLMGRDFLFGGTGDPAYTLKIAPDELRRVTNAQVAAIAQAGRSRAASADR